MEPTLTAEKLEEEQIISAEELLARDDCGRSELVEGVIVEMSPTRNRHGAIELNVGAELRTFVRRHKLGYVRVGEVGIYTGRNPDTVRAADAFFISNERYNRRQKEGFLDVAPELVVEILSPSDTWSNVMTKMQEYFNAGVTMIWIVDSENPAVYVYRSLTEVRYFTEGDVLPGDEILPGLELPVAALFADL